MALRIAVIGDGQMGLVMADLLAQNGHNARLWGPFANHVAAVAADRRSPKHLPEFRIHDSILVTGDAAAALEGVDAIVDAIPTQYIRRLWRGFSAHVPEGVPIVSVSKGIEQETLLRPLQVLADALGEPVDLSGRPMVCLSGPTIAAELAKRMPATMLAASHDIAAAERVQEALGADWLRIYTHDDVTGVEIAGAVKNVIALAAGMVDGMNLGYNAKSALLSRGLAEMARLGMVLGARRETFFGVAGVGDLATTCFSPYGRNRSCGEALGRGISLEEHLAATASVVEGVATTRSVIHLAERNEIELPISAAVHAILFEDLSPRDAITQLMERDVGAEVVG